MTEYYAGRGALEKTFPDEYANASVIFGSSFPKDQEFAQVCILSMQIHKGKSGLATSLSRGKIVEGKKARETCNTWHAH